MWGNGEDGQLGLECTQNQHLPTPLSFFGTHRIAKGLSCSARYSAVHTEDGSLFVWGALGADDQEPFLQPHQVQATRRKQGTAITSVSCSNTHMLVLSGKICLLLYSAPLRCRRLITSAAFGYPPVGYPLWHPEETGILCQWGPISSISLDTAKAAFSGSMLTGKSVRRYFTKFNPPEMHFL